MNYIPEALKPISNANCKKAMSAYGLSQLLFNSLMVLGLIFFLIGKDATANEKPIILALGDSLTAGYGLEAGLDFPTKLEQSLHQQGIQAKVINGGVSGDTTAGGLARLDWMMTDNPDLVIIELGANDGLRALNPDDTRKNLAGILSQLKKRDAKILLTGMLAPPNLGTDYEAKFNPIYPTLAAEFNVPLYPFFLDGVVTDPTLNQGDGIHPNAKGVDVIVRKITPHVIAALKGETP